MEATQRQVCGVGGSRVTMSMQGQFAGLAWAENIGWINMANGCGSRESVLRT